MGRGRAPPIRFSIVYLTAHQIIDFSDLARIFGSSIVSARPGLPRENGSDLHKTRALTEPAHHFRGVARGFDGRSHGLAPVLSRIERRTRIRADVVCF